ncbi:MAG: serine hydrolase domain-containing protein [Anaerolineae bacterium]
MKKLPFGLLILVLLTAACATGTPAATPTVVEIPLVTFADQHFGIQMLRPEGWTEIEPGTWVQTTSPPHMPQLFYGAFPGMSMGWADVYFSRELGLERLPDREGVHESEALTWELTTFEVDHPEAGPIVVDGALSETDTALYVLGVLAPRADHDFLHGAVFLPALEALSPLAVDDRDQLTASELMADEYQGAGPVYNDYFLPLGESGSALHNLEGTLTVPEFKMQFGAPGDVDISGSQELFPGFSVEFFTYEDYLVPSIRDIVPASSGNSYWSIILSPGKVWSEPSDDGLSRASFPFILVSDPNNQAHNGVATFLYDDSQVSSFHFQVTQETASWKRVDLWGQSPMEYTPGPIENRDVMAAQFAEEVSLQTPIRPWSDLEKDHDPRLLATFNGDIHPWHVSAAGLISDDTIYLQACQTRYGRFPYCRQMRHGVFSVTKSMAAAIAMLRLAKEYGEEIFDLKVADWVEVTADHDGWEQVTFGDALNMATGIGDDPNLQAFTAEEDQPRFDEFLEARSAQDKLDVCFSYGNYPWGPGEVARYNSINTFVLSAAMDSFLKGKEGPEADIWDMVVEEVYKPIGIFHAPMMRTHEPDGSRGIPIFGFGLYPTVDDVAKVTRLLLNGGQHEGQQLLHSGKLHEALYETDVTGLPTGDSNEYGEATYHMSFWSSPFRTAGGDFFLIPYMTGFGGNHVALAPNGLVAFRFADAHIYGVGAMVRVAEVIRPWRK